MVSPWRARDGDRGRAEHDAPRRAQREQDRLGQELDPDLALVAPGHGAARYSDRVEHRDDHDVGLADRADQQGNRAEAEGQGVEGAFASACATSADEGWARWPRWGFGSACAASRLAARFTWLPVALT